MRSRPDHLIRNLLLASLIILAAMHPAGTRHLAQIATELVLAVVQGVADAIAAQPGPAVLLATAVWAVHRIRTHRAATR